jgi:hypothetical protein
MIKLKDNNGVMVLLMKLPKLSTNNKEDSNSYAHAPSSKKDIPQAISAQPAYGIPTMMVQSLSNMKMTKCTASFAYSVLLHK